MSAQPQFDTLAAARALQGAGMDSTQAETVAEKINEAVAAADMPHRSEISALRAELRAEMTSLRSELRADMAALETRLTWRMFLVVGSLLALATTIERLLG